jgi:hypothetical protein
MRARRKAYGREEGLADKEIRRLIELLEEKACEIQRLSERLEKRDEQLRLALGALEQSQELLALQTKTCAAVMDCLRRTKGIEN